MHSDATVPSGMPTSSDRSDICGSFGFTSPFCFLVNLTVMRPFGVGTAILAAVRFPGAGFAIHEPHPGVTGRTPINPDAIALAGVDAHG